MENYYTCPIEELTKTSKIRLEVCDVEVDMYWKVAMEVLSVIEENNRKNKTTFMIVPYGPLGPYARIVYLVNKHRISLKNCVFCNMDEYITDDGEYIDKNDPLSFRGGMDRIFYSQIDDELNVLPENRYFPDPKNPDIVLQLIEKYGVPDMVFGGVGINGHYAFNEPPYGDEPCTNEEFLNRQTRVLEVSRETRTINGFMNAGGNFNAIPRYCITVGMKEMFMAKKVRMCMPRDWNAGALRPVLSGKVDCHVPCSLFQLHPDAMLYATREALQAPVPEIRVYNK
ncbi:MAG TPA: glucosamine-6-phosphate isomerase [Ruminococcaceae bacterium]|nr:glucosamine-6-phosphate isomerase [Oscillospiraceae bacterium]